MRRRPNFDKGSVDSGRMRAKVTSVEGRTVRDERSCQKVVKAFRQMVCQEGIIASGHCFCHSMCG
jgi:hypothetical protein